MHTRKAMCVAVVGMPGDHARMETARIILMEGLAPVVGALVRATAVLAWGILIVCWCLLVFLMSGRFPWFVRKYL